MKYHVLPFIITASSNDLVLQNAYSICVINNKSMKSFLEEIDSKCISIVDEEILNKYFQDNQKEALEYLFNNKIIEEEKNIHLEFSKIHFLTNDSLFYESLTFNCKGNKFDYKIDKLDNDFEYLDFYNDNLYIVILNPFNLYYFKELVNFFKNKDLLCKFAFSYNNCFYFSNYYKREWGNPCPLCFFSQIEAMLRSESKAYKIMNFQTILDIIYRNDPKFEVNIIFTNYSALGIVNHLLNDLNCFNNYDINKISYIDLNNRNMNYDCALHWELCDCYE